MEKRCKKMKKGTAVVVLAVWALANSLPQVLKRCIIIIRHLCIEMYRLRKMYKEMKQRKAEEIVNSSLAPFENFEASCPQQLSWLKQQTLSFHAVSRLPLYHMRFLLRPLSMANGFLGQTQNERRMGGRESASLNL